MVKMPPSPAWGCSPGRELRGEKHKRGRSLDGGLLLREKEDDLALFNDMETRERDNFLLESTDDLDDSLSTKLRYFSSFKLGISIPARGESSDLLNADGDKNDYDWLLTPPDTPLFPSLDDEPPPIDIPCRGRPRSQPVSIARSATTDKSYMTSRGSASPHRRSPSPRSINSISRSRGRPSSASHSSPAPVSRPTTPSRSPSTPQNKPSTPAPRSSTPTLQRPSMGLSGNAASSGRSGTSPVKGSRGNSASPKMHAWQSGIPGFSSDAPPNLRTSLSDRPASYVRGSSPASRNGRGLSPASSNGRGLSPASGNGRESSAKSGRQSMSPTASRSASSSYSHDRDQNSSRSKGSVASSGDDDIDSLQSVSVSVSDRSSARKVNGFSNSRSPAISKKPSRTISSSSAPKRSFDSALRQMDRKNPQKMFRPLLSSVPSTTFYSGKPNSASQPMVSRNSSVVTSSNPSSEQSASVVPDTLGTDHEQDDATEWEKPPYSDAQDEIFILDKVDGMNRDIEHEIHKGKPERCEFEGSTSEVKSGESEKFSSHNVGAISASASESLNVEVIDCHENTPLCSKCGRKLCFMEPREECDRICPVCSEKDGCFAPATPGITPVVTHNTSIRSEMTLEEDRSFDELEPEMGMPNPTEFATKSAALLVRDEINVEQYQSCLLDSSLARSMLEEGKQHLVDHQLVGQVRVDFKQDDYDTADQQLQHFNDSECAGISILLNRSSSGHVVQGRAFTATNIPHNDLSYARGSANSLKSSMVHGSFSASSSVDLTSSKQTEAHVKRQSSGRKDDLENSRNDLVSKTRSRGSSFSGNLDHSCQTLITPKRTSEGNLDVSVGSMEFKALDKTLLFTRELSKDTETDDTHSSFDRTAVLEGNKFGWTESCKTMGSSISEVSSHTLSIRLEDTSVAPFPNDDDCVSSGNADEFPYKASEIPDIEAPGMTPESFIDVVKDSTCDSLGMVPGEQENGHERIPDSQTDCSCSPKSKYVMDECKEPSFTISEKDTSVCAMKSSISDGYHDIYEESTVTVGGEGHEARSLTLEEATDTILFCSSIIHNLAYQAATIGMEKEKSIPLEGSRPTVTILGKTNTDRKDSRGRIGSKRPTKSPKARQKRVEVDGKIPSTKIETNKENYESMALDSAVPNKVDSLRPPKLESKCNCTVM